MTKAGRRYVRLVRKKASSPQAQGADNTGHRYYVQLMLEGHAFLKPKNRAGQDIIGLDIGPSTLASVSRDGPVQLQVLGQELQPKEHQQRRLQRKMERQRRATNPQNYNEAMKSQLQRAMVSIVRVRFPDLTELAQQRSRQIENPDILGFLLEKIAGAEDEAEVRAVLRPPAA